MISNSTPAGISTPIPVQSHPEDAPPMKKWCCLIDSELLGEKIALVARQPLVEKARELYPGTVVYTCQEIRCMDGVGPQTVREIHDLKKTFNGSFCKLV
jgi:hypothetical protein